MYRRAAEQGIAAAQLKLGSMHYGGVGVARDKDEAYFWTYLASERGNIIARLDLAMVADAMAPAKVAAAEKRAKTWLAKRPTS